MLHVSLLDLSLYADDLGKSQNSFKVRCSKAAIRLISRDSKLASTHWKAIMNIGGIGQQHLWALCTGDSANILKYSSSRIGTNILTYFTYWVHGFMERFEKDCIKSKGSKLIWSNKLRGGGGLFLPKSIILLG